MKRIRLTSRVSLLGALLAILGGLGVAALVGSSLLLTVGLMTLDDSSYAMEEMSGAGTLSLVALLLMCPIWGYLRYRKEIL
jgi:hypothetical protein